MALEWYLKLKDGFSASAKKAASAAGDLEDKLKGAAKASDKLGAAGQKAEFFRDKLGRLRHSSGRFATEAEKLAHGMSGIGKAAKGAATIIGGAIGDVPTKKFGKWAQSFVGLAQKLGLSGRRGQMAQGIGRFVQGIDDKLKSSFFGTITYGDLAQRGLAAGKAFAGAFVSAAATIAVAGTAVFLAAVGKISLAIANFQQDKSKTLFAFDKLLGAGGGEKAWAAIRAAADKTKTPLQETATAFNNLVAAGFELSRADTIFRQLADLKTLNPQANLDGIVRAIGQIKNTGKLQGDELMQLAEAGINVGDVYEEIGKKLGKTRDEVLKLQSAGKISADVAINAVQAAIAKKTGADPGAVAGSAPKSVPERVERLKQKFFDLVSMDFGPLMRFFDRLESALDGDAGRELAAAFEDLFKAGGEILDSFTREDLEGLLRASASAVRDLASGLREAAAAAKEINDAMRTWDRLTGQQGGSTLGGVTRGLGHAAADAATGGAFSFIGLAWDAFVAQWDLIGSLASKFLEAISMVRAQAGTWFDSAVSLGTSLIDGIIAGVRQKWDALLSDISQLGASARDAFGAAIGEGSPAREFFPAGRSIDDGIAVGVEQNRSAVTGAVAGVGAAAVGAAAGGSVRRMLTTNNINRSMSSQATYQINGNPTEQQLAATRQIVRQELRLAMQ